VVEGANGLGFLAIAIGYLPALFQAFSRRETAVSRLDPRAGSPPTPGALLEHSSRRGLADLAHAFTSGRLVARPDGERLSEASLAELLRRLEGSGLHCEGSGLHSEEREESRKRLEHLRGSYELYAFTISHQLALDLPDWVPEEVQGNWRAATRRESRGPLS
jgi:hypothetical protein